jgi:hypothetical protein
MLIFVGYDTMQVTAWSFQLARALLVILAFRLSPSCPLLNRSLRSFGLSYNIRSHLQIVQHPLRGHYGAGVVLSQAQ